MANGGVIGKRIVPSSALASGIWGGNEIYNASRDSIWPAFAQAVTADFLIIAGGGGGGAVGLGGERASPQSGGGAGGYLNSYASEASGANSSSLNAVTFNTAEMYSITIGAGGAIDTNGSNTSLSGTDFNGGSVSLVAIGGGAGGDYATTDAAGGGQDGGSGGGGGYGGPSGTNVEMWQRGNGTSNQGTIGGNAYVTIRFASMCSQFGGIGSGWCSTSNTKGGGGGGASSAGTYGQSSGAGGQGLASSITGSSVTRAAGGSGRGVENANSAAMPAGSGSSSPGGGGEGGSTSNTGGDGVVILRYPNGYIVSNPGGGLTFSTTTTGNDRVTEITAGTGNIRFGGA